MKQIITEQEQLRKLMNLTESNPGDDESGDNARTKLQRSHQAKRGYVQKDTNMFKKLFRKLIGEKPLEWRQMSPAEKRDFKDQKEKEYIAWKEQDRIRQNAADDESFLKAMAYNQDKTNKLSAKIDKEESEKQKKADRAEMKRNSRKTAHLADLKLSDAERRGQ